MRPFLDQPIQLGPFWYTSDFLRIRTILAGSSLLYDLDTLHTLRSPSFVWTASISAFCLDDDACHDSVTIGDGARFVLRLCNIVKRGCKVAIKSDPF